MQSSPGWRKPQLRSSLFVAVFAFAVLATSAFLAFAVATAPRAYVRIAAPRVSVVRVPAASPAPQPAGAERPPRTLWSMLQPFAFGADALAIAGLALILTVRRRR